MNRGQRGFTLIETLVVIVIIVVLASTIIFGFVGADREQKLRAEAEQLALLIELARAEALQRNEEWGVAVGDAGYRFLVFDAQRGRWVENRDRPFQPRAVADIALTVHVDALSIPGTKTAKDAPGIVLFSSGEQTPFEIELVPAWQSAPWRVASDGLSRTIAQRGV